MRHFWVFHCVLVLNSRFIAHKKSQVLPKSKWQIFNIAVASYESFCPQERATVITSFSLQEGGKKTCKWDLMILQGVNI